MRWLVDGTWTGTVFFYFRGIMSVQRALMNKLDYEGIIILIKETSDFRILDIVLECPGCDHRVVAYVDNTYLSNEDIDYDEDTFERATLEQIKHEAPLFYEKHLRGLYEG